ncbi:albusnodin/ikarugamycin family macrolactam cyclase [Streptomyces sp. NRRL F-5123]|uniref:albusnodin/ikarugamycin family macrolactam cyclase n=1 Tax=Streptomyces sp. NRRL F-5123 TaxID=1463856 RepID=UPI0005B8ABFC|nr:albusnodin/ikarugamycin family macrolactam cyclase [Streptomyces sp. NRRL F-5123]
MIFGGFSATPVASVPRPAASVPLAPGSSAWRLGDGPAHVLTAESGPRRVLVLGWCGAEKAELARLADGVLPADIAWRWPGAYAVVEEATAAAVVYTDPAAACPVYVTRSDDGWAWSSSARLLAALTGAAIDTERLACSVFLPSVPGLAAGRTFFDGVRQLPPGCRVVLPGDGTAWRATTVWRPEPVPGQLPVSRLREALESAVGLRANAPGLTSDLSGGLDSTSVAVLAAAMAGQRLNAVTVHPAENLEGADLRHARQAAARWQNRIAHHLLPLSEEHLPYTEVADAPATDEPAPSTLTRARLAAQLDWMRDKLGSRTHLTGDGGDSVLFQSPIHLADLVRHRHPRRAVSEAFGWARLRHAPVAPLLRDAYRLAHTSRDEALKQLAAQVGEPGRDDHGKVVWFPLLPFPSWGEPTVTRMLVASAHRAVAEPDQLGGLDFAIRAGIDEIREVARSAVADAQLARTRGIDLHNPFLDGLVVDAVLTTPLARRAALHAYKPHLACAMADLLPPDTAARTTKGSFDADHFTGMRANLPELSGLADGYLAALGMVHPGRFRRHLAQAAAGLPMSLATLEQALTAEAWLTAHHRDPAPAWTRTPARSETLA